MIRSKHAARPHPHQCWPVRWFGMIWLCGWRRFWGRDAFGQNNLQDPQIEELWFATQTSPQPIVTSDNPNFPAKFSWNLGPMDLTPMKPWSTWWVFCCQPSWHFRKASLWWSLGVSTGALGSWAVRRFSEIDGWRVGKWGWTGLHFVCWGKLLGLTLQDLQVTYFLCRRCFFQFSFGRPIMAIHGPAPKSIFWVPLSMSIWGLPGATVWVDWTNSTSLETVVKYQNQLLISPIWAMGALRVDSLPNMACCRHQIPLDGGLLLDTNQDLLNKNWATNKSGDVNNTYHFT